MIQLCNKWTSNDVPMRCLHKIQVGVSLRHVLNVSSPEITNQISRKCHHNSQNIFNKALNGVTPVYLHYILVGMPLQFSVSSFMVMQCKWCNFQFSEFHKWTAHWRLSDELPWWCLLGTSQLLFPNWLWILMVTIETFFQFITNA